MDQGGLLLALPTLTEKATFAEAPVIMEFRRETGKTAEQHDTCDGYNRRKLHSLAQDKKPPIAKFTASYEGVSSADGAEMDDELFGGMQHTLEGSSLFN